MSLMSQADFARHIGKTPGYITQQKDAGRIVMQGRMVNVEETIKLMDETKDPSKAGVADRHDREREQKQAIQPVSGQAGYVLDDMTGKAGSAYQQARAMKEKYAAMQAKITYEKEVGKLLEASDVAFPLADAISILRNKLESMPDIHSAQFAAESDEQKIRTIMMDYVEHMLGELSQSFHKLTKQGAMTATKQAYDEMSND